MRAASLGRIEAKDAAGEDFNSAHAGAHAGRVDGLAPRTEVLPDGLDEAADVGIVAGDGALEQRGVDDRLA
jgi:hypothetical protein